MTKETPAKGKSSHVIKKDMTLGEVLSSYPKTAPVFMKHGLHCIGCHIAFMETIEQGCKAHGMSDKQLDELLKELNDVAESSKN